MKSLSLEHLSNLGDIMPKKLINLDGGCRVITEDEAEHAHKIYMEICDQFTDILSLNLGGEPAIIRDYVETRILDEYRPWNYTVTINEPLEG